ncbi:MAG: hypothetical protein AAFQ82_24020, partial [Myxococcota bacterium]
VVDGAEQLGWRVDNQGFGDGGLFSEAQWHGTGGLGVKIFLGEVIAFRTELMTYGWIDEFNFRTGTQSFPTYRYFLNTGLSFSL